MSISNGQGILGSLCANGFQAQERMDLRMAASRGQCLAMALPHRLDGMCTFQCSSCLHTVPHSLSALPVLARRDATSRAVKHGQLCLAKSSDDSIALVDCSTALAPVDLQITLHQSGALIHGNFVPPPPPPPPPAPGRHHSTCSSLQNNTDVVGPRVVNTHPNKDRCGVTLEQCCAMCDSDSKCVAFTLDPDANWAGTCVGKTL